MLEPKQELTTLDLCKMFGVTRTTIYDWRRKGLPYYKLGGNGLLDPVRYERQTAIDFAKGIGRSVVNEVF